jgi:glycosyltransferase involved in cell wall biosynthesis
MEKPLLSILIPAYNQAALLEQTLQNLQVAIATCFFENKHHLIEVIVSDNSSSDRTALVTKKFAGSFQTIRQEDNLGFLGNIDYLAGKATGQYLWFLGCGETFRPPNLLLSLIDTLNSRRVLNVVLGSSGSGDPLPPSSELIEVDRSLKASSLFSEAISGNIFHAEAYAQAKQVGLVHDSWWPHIERLLDMFRNPNFFDYVTVGSVGAPLTIGVSPTGWAYDQNSYLAPARELNLLYLEQHPHKALKFQRKRLGYIYLPLWIWNQKLNRRFKFSWDDLRSCNVFLRPCPFLMHAGVLIVLLAPGWVFRPFWLVLSLTRTQLSKLSFKEIRRHHVSKNAK